MKERQVLESIAQQMQKIPGHTGFYYKNLTTGYEFGVREDEAYPAASVIKFPLFLHILSESARGNMSMDERLTITAQDKVPICGALTLFTGEVEADVRTLCRLMISISDNTATNKLIRHVTIEGANAGFAEMGLEKTVLRRTISEETSQIMCQLMGSVVSEGTAKNASVSGYFIGGKTGTSEKIDVFDENGQRVQDKIVSFVGVAPMDDPQYIVLVALDTPSRSTGIYISGGVMAAPTVGAVLEDILPYLGVTRTYGPEDAAGQVVVLEDYAGMTPEEAQKLLKKLGLTAVVRGQGETVVSQLPSAGQSVPGNSQVLLYLSEATEPGTVAVPDFSGMHRQQAADAAGKAGLYILVSGNTEISPQVTVVAQDIAPGTQVTVGTTIKLKFLDTQAAD